MTQDSFSRSRRRRRVRGDGGRGSGGGSRRCLRVGGAGRLRRLILLSAVALVWRHDNLLVQAACAAGFPGILSSDGTTCCLEACGQCGGSGCSDVPGTAETDCCVNDIRDSGRTCGTNGIVAPCSVDPSVPLAQEAVIAAPSPAPAAGLPPGNVPAAPIAMPVSAAEETPEPVVPPTAAPVTALTPGPAAPTEAPLAPGVVSTCSNGYPGFQTNEACCSEFCGQCGGAGCGELGSATCCFNNIIASGQICGRDTFEAPCIIDELAPEETDGETPAPLPAATPVPAPGPSPVPAPVASPVQPRTPTPTPTAVAATTAPVPRGAGMPTTAPVAAVATGAPAAGGGGRVETLAPTVEECAGGIEGHQNGVICCSTQCGQCGGAGCENLPGGASACCSDTILRLGERCGAGVSAPCILGTVDEVPSAVAADSMVTSAAAANLGVIGGAGWRGGLYSAVLGGLATLATAGLAPALA